MISDVGQRANNRRAECQSSLQVNNTARDGRGFLPVGFILVVRLLLGSVAVVAFPQVLMVMSRRLSLAQGYNNVMQVYSLPCCMC